MQNTIIGVYDSFDQAQSAMNDVIAAGIPRSKVQLNPHADSTGVNRASSVDENTGDSGSSGGIGHFFRSLFGMEEDEENRSEQDLYSEAIRRGSSVLTVDADSEDQRDQVIAIMNRYDPVDLDKRSSHWRSEGWTGYDESAPSYTQSEIENERTRYGSAGTTAAGTGASATAANTSTGKGKGKVSGKQSATTEEATSMPVVEEQMKVGKRVVQHGGVRVVRRVTEQPVHESVDLRKEHVRVDRRPVDKPADQADLAAFKEGSVEMREMAEEPVVSKEARVVEEIEIGKEVSHETADVDDTVRRSDVEVEQLGASSATRNSDIGDTIATSDDSDYRTHWQNAYGKSGDRYEDYDSAYRYGQTMAGSERFRNYRWEDAEPELRSDWESRHPESTWDKVKDAVRYGAEKTTGRR